MVNNNIMSEVRRWCTLAYNLLTISSQDLKAHVNVTAQRLDEMKEGTEKSNRELRCEVRDIQNAVDELDQCIAMMERKIRNMQGLLGYYLTNPFLEKDFDKAFVNCYTAYSYQCDSHRILIEMSDVDTESPMKRNRFIDNEAVEGGVTSERSTAFPELDSDNSITIQPSKRFCL